MRIAHVVTYISPDGAFGGPVRVALGQAEALAARGHDVTVYAASPPELAGTVERDGYLLRTFPGKRILPALGFASMHSPGLTRALRRDLAGVDAAHVHLARDLVTIPAALAIRAAAVPFVAQTHGMIDKSKRALAKMLDALATRSLLRDAESVLVLTLQEEADINGIEPHASVQRIANGVKLLAIPTYENRPQTVLFLARLHPRKRPLAFVEMAQQLMQERPDLRAILVGPDEGEAEAVVRAINNSPNCDRIEWLGAIPPDQTYAYMANARAYVLPAEGEVFPMSILEAFQAGTPVITTSSLGIAEACERYGAAVITDGTPRALASAVREVLDSVHVASRLRQGGIDYMTSELDINVIARELEALYRKADRASPGRGASRS